MNTVAANELKPPSSSLTTPRVVLMAVATGLAVASNYYAQPLLPAIGEYFGLSTTAAASIVTVAQLSYALGLILLVPLGDLYERRGLIVSMMLLSAVGLLITACAPHIWVVMVGTAITGTLSVVAQVLVPHTATMAAPEERGKRVGTVMSGLLLGVLLARTAAGVLTDMGSWRTIFWLAALLMVIMAGALWRWLPTYQNPSKLHYLRLLGSIFRLYAEEPLVRARSLLGIFLFASFGILWTPLAFLLANPPYQYSSTTIGLFGLAGAAGAYAANRFGRMADRGRSNTATRLGLGLLVLSWGPIAIGQFSLLALVLGIVVQDLAIQGVHITNQAAIYSLRPEARSRLTAGYMTCYFLGGAAGSLASASAYAHAGWLGVVALGATLGVVALAYGCLAPAARIPASVTY
jgi:predicted MFS family arabinose efflux permease